MPCRGARNAGRLRGCGPIVVVVAVPGVALCDHQEHDVCVYFIKCDTSDNVEGVPSKYGT